ncbi:hypothetical protein [Streptomyces sp. EN27]|uniref:hypothetical protein n=1 Tax=Streptomyces sp. EN27 TaxID=211464 RepID=UPI0008518CD8|nr:hypothetical protein [Streptomyces sp. EN27]
MSADTAAPQTADTTDTDAVAESGTATVVDIATGTPVNTDTGTDTGANTDAGQVRAALDVRAALAQARSLLSGGIGGLFTGSWALAGLGCTCVGRVLRWGWEQASADPEAAAQLAAHTKRAAAVAKAVEKAKEEGEEEKAAAALEALGAAPSGRRPALEALAYLALGGMLAAGALATLAALIAPHLGALAPYKPLILAAGGLGWAVAAWTVAPPPRARKKKAGPDDDVVQDEPEETTEDEPQESPGTLLLWHLITALSDAESVGRAGLHLDVVLASAIENGLLPETTEAAEWRAWVESCGIPVAEKVGYRIEGKPVTRVGVRIDAVTTVLGMSPTALLTARSQALAGGGPATPARPVGETPLLPPAETAPETPVQTPAGAPVPAALRLLPGGRQHPASAPSPTLSQGSAQEAR